MTDDTQPDDKQPGQVAEQPAEYTATPAPRTKVLKNGAIYSMDTKRIVMWAAFRVIAYATQGKYGMTIVPELTAMDAMKRWEEA